MTPEPIDVQKLKSDGFEYLTTSYDYYDAREALKTFQEEPTNTDNLAVELVNGYLGMLNTYRSNFEDAEKNLTTAYETNYGNEGHDNRRALWLGNLGIVHRCHYQYEKAQKCFEEALENAKGVKDEAEKVKMVMLCEGNLGNLYREQARSVPFSTDIEKHLDDEQKFKKTFDDLSKGVVTTKSFEEARGHLNKALELAQDKHEKATWIGNIGTLHLDKGEYAKAITQFDSALEILEKLDCVDWNLHANLLGNKAIAINGSGKNTDEAKTYFERARQLSSRNKNEYQKRTWYGHLGIWYHEQRNYNQAIDMYSKALEKISDNKFQDKKSESVWTGYMGDSYRKLGVTNEAQECYNEAYDIALKMKDVPLMGLWHGRKGIIDLIHGRYDDSRKKLAVALIIVKKIEMQKEIALFEGQLGLLNMELGQYEDAGKQFAKACESSKDVRSQCTWLSYYGDALLENDNEKAAQKYEEALKIAEEIDDRNEISSLRIKLARVHANDLLNEASIFKEARKLARTAMGISDKARWLGNLGNEGKKEDRLFETADKYEEAIKLVDKLKDKNQQAYWRSNLGIANYLLNQKYPKSEQKYNDKALENLKKSKEVYEELWRELESDNHRITFDDIHYEKTSLYLQSQYFDSGKSYKEALLECVNSRSKSMERLLWEQRSSNQTETGKRKELHTDVEFERMQTIAKERGTAIIVYSRHVDDRILIWVINSTSKSRSESKPFVPELDDTIKDLVGKSRVSIGVPKIEEINEGKSNTKSATGFLNGDITQRGREWSDIGCVVEATCQAIGGKQRNVRVARRIKGEKDRKEINLDEGLKGLYKLLIKPIEDVLAEEKRLTIIPYDDLFKLPFAALKDENGKHLIEKYALSFAPSVGTLVELQNRGNDHRTSFKDLSVLIVGNPTNYMKALPNAEQEAAEIKSLLKDAVFFKNEEATKKAVKSKMREANIIHFAAHGSKDGVYLAGETDDDCILSMGEVQDLHLDNAKMVVLSACDTFKGDLRSDGVVGITRAFLVAGSSSVVASLWPVDDSSTKELMTKLYKNLLQGQVTGKDGSIDVSYALQKAMIYMLEKEDNRLVKYWAPFLVYGL